jgi:hypothetical protein
MKAGVQPGRVDEHYGGDPQQREQTPVAVAAGSDSEQIQGRDSLRCGGLIRGILQLPIHATAVKHLLDRIDRGNTTAASPRSRGGQA